MKFENYKSEIEGYVKSFNDEWGYDVEVKVYEDGDVVLDSKLFFHMETRYEKEKYFLLVNEDEALPYKVHELFTKIISLRSKEVDEEYYNYK